MDSLLLSFLPKDVGKDTFGVEPLPFLTLQHLSSHVWIALQKDVHSLVSIRLVSSRHRPKLVGKILKASDVQTSSPETAEPCPRLSIGILGGGWWRRRNLCLQATRQATGRSGIWTTQCLGFVQRASKNSPPLAILLKANLQLQYDFNKSFSKSNSWSNLDSSQPKPNLDSVVSRQKAGTVFQHGFVSDTKIHLVTLLRGYCWSGSCGNLLHSCARNAGRCLVPVTQVEAAHSAQHCTWSREGWHDILRNLQGQPNSQKRIYSTLPSWW